MRRLTSACYSGGFKSGEEWSTVLPLSSILCLMLLSCHLLLPHFFSILKLFMSLYFPLNPPAAKCPHIHTYFISVFLCFLPPVAFGSLPFSRLSRWPMVTQLCCPKPDFESQTVVALVWALHVNVVHRYFSDLFFV